MRDSESPRIHVFLASSDIHVAHQLHKNREDIMEMSRRAAVRAR